MNEKQITAREYLEQIKMQDKKVSKMRVKLKMLRDSMGLKAVSYESIGAKPSNHQTDTIAEAICKIIDYEDEVKEEEAKLAILRFDAEKAIQAISDENARDVLERWYLLFQPVEKIMHDMTYRKSSVYFYRDKGLREFVVPLLKSQD